MSTQGTLRALPRTHTNCRCTSCAVGTHTPLHSPAWKKTEPQPSLLGSAAALRARCVRLNGRHGLIKPGRTPSPPLTHLLQEDPIPRMGTIRSPIETPGAGATSHLRRSTCAYTPIDTRASTCAPSAHCLHCLGLGRHRRPAPSPRWRLTVSCCWPLGCYAPCHPRPHPPCRHPPYLRRCVQNHNRTRPKWVAFTAATHTDHLHSPAPSQHPLPSQPHPLAYLHRRDP